MREKTFKNSPKGRSELPSRAYKAYPEEVQTPMERFKLTELKKSIQTIYRTCFAPRTLEQIEKNNKWEVVYRAIGKALKEVLERR